jgi:DNA replication protein DnaC
MRACRLDACPDRLRNDRADLAALRARLHTRNLPFDEWTEVFGSERLTGALLDRLTHRVNILETNGESYRLSESRSRTAKADA